MRHYILHWRTGEAQSVSGYDIADACRRAGLGGGALAALDYFEEVIATEIPAVVVDEEIDRRRGR